MDAGDDPFSCEIIPNCQTTSSQEYILQFSRFAGESGTEVPSQSLLGDSIEEEEEPLTQIIIESLPDTQNDPSSVHEDEEEFQTPPEQQTSQHFSSDDQAPPAKKVFGGGGSGGGGGGGGEQEMEVDDRFGDGDERRGVYLGDDIADLGFEVKRRNVDIGVSGGDFCSTGDKVEEIGVCDDDEPRKVANVEADFHVSRVSATKLGAGTLKDTVMVESEETEMENVGVENLESEFKEACAGLMDRMMEPALNVFDKMPVRELKQTVCDGQNKNAAIENPVRKSKANKSTHDPNEISENSDCGLGSKNIEDIEKFKYISTGERRKLPFPMRAKDNNGAAESSMAKKRGLEGILDSLKLVMGEVDNGTEEVDFLDTAKKRGLTFPRPRWWPPEGSDS